jgi:hypothetical protein
MLDRDYVKEGSSREYDDHVAPQITSTGKDDPDTDHMTKYNGATWRKPLYSGY